MTSGNENTIEEHYWQRLGEALEDFANAWEAAPPEPAIAKFVERFPETIGTRFHVAALAELIKVDMEFRAGSDFEFLSVSDYAKHWPQLNQDGKFPPDLLYEEVRALKSKTTSATDTIQSQPHDIEKIAEMFDADFSKSTSILPKLRANKYKPGMTIGDFDLLSTLGRGTFATVFLARQNSMQRLVALKISADHGVEGQTLAKLDHPHIVRVYDQRVVEKPPIRLMYMQYIAGTSLKQLTNEMGLRQSGTSFIELLDKELDRTGEPAPVQSENRLWISKSQWPQIVSRLGAQLAGALDYSHLQGVLHRDIKPANVLVDMHGFPKLVDFNISFSSEVAGTTASTFFGGTLAYMSPEQLEACSAKSSRKPNSLDQTTDIYSLGLVLYELLTGDRPFVVGDTTGEATFMQHSIRMRKIGLDRTERKILECENELLVDAINRCLEPKSENRFQNGKSLQRQLSWASDTAASNYLARSKRGWRKIVGDWPFLSIILAGLAISMFATWFVISFNMEEAIAKADQETFQWLRRMINRVVYPVVLVVCFFLIRPVSRALKIKPISSSGNPGHSSDDAAEDLKSAIKSNLNLASHLALTFAVAWSVAGISYPVILTLFGAAVSISTWTDFVFISLFRWLDYSRLFLLHRFSIFIERLASQIGSKIARPRN